MHEECKKEKYDGDKGDQEDEKAEHGLFPIDVPQTRQEQV